MWSLDISDLRISFSHIMVVGLTLPLAEMSIRNLSAGKPQSVHNADILTAISEPNT
jgi:hypothetical protein